MSRILDARRGGDDSLDARRGASPPQVCDQPHPHVARSILEACLSADLEAALAALRKLFDSGYAAVDIIGRPRRGAPPTRAAGSDTPVRPGTLFKVVKYHKMAEPKQLEFIKEIGFTHTRIVDGSATLTQLTGLVARLVQLADAAAPQQA